MKLNNRLQSLLDDLRELHKIFRDYTFQKYKRINPFTEDIFDWKERGEYWCKEDRNITIYNSTSLVGDVKIGDNTWIGPSCNIGGQGGLSIGRFCSIAAGTKIMTHDSIKWALSGGREKYEYAPVHIGDYCFLGVNSVITKGVTIGDHCLVAAGAVVSKDFPSYSIIGGVPADIIGHVSITESDGVNLFYS
jgi:acetyltransferase-like isoleucine patch superfamily enzyme